MHEFIHVMALPCVASLILAGIHAYLGFHVIERQVIFVDLALAQIAVLGASLGLVAGWGLDTSMSYWASLIFTVIGAAIFSFTRLKDQKVPQEAIIGITYAVCAALLIMVLSRSAEGDEQIKQSLVGNILLVNGAQVLKIFCIYAAVGICHFIFRRQFLLISRDPQEAFNQGLNVRFWDFFFYVLFGIVVTSSVKIAGVLLVFSLLIVPPVCAMLLTTSLLNRLLLGWAIGLIGSVLGMGLSYYGDFPTGASVVTVFGVILAIIGIKTCCKY